MQNPPYYCLLNCEDAEKWSGHEKVAHDALHPHARWDHFKAYACELPPLDTLGKYTGVFITGGHYSAYEDRKWIHELASWLGEAVRSCPQVKFLGICFGCQILARGLGGEVGKNPSRKFVLMVEDIRLSPALQRDPAYLQALQDVAAAGTQPPPLPAEAASSCNDTSSPGGVKREGSEGGPAPPLDPVPTSSGTAGLIRLIQSHGDQVLRLPPGAAPLGESDTAAHEVWGLGGNVLALQGHPELSGQVVMEKIHPAITAAGRLTPAESVDAAHSLTTTHPDSQLVLRLMRRFMERGLACCEPPPAAVSAQPTQAPAAQVPSKVQPTAAASASTSPPGWDDAVPWEPAVAAAAAAAGPGSAGTVEGMDRMLQALCLGVEAELGRGPEEYRHLQECNASAEEHYRRMGHVMVQANKVLQAVHEQQSALAPALDAIGSLEAQVCQLEGVMAHLEATSARLQHSLDSLAKQ